MNMASVLDKSNQVQVISALAEGSGIRQIHPKASNVYAWAHDTDDPKNPKRHVTVLHLHPITSPVSAVLAFIVPEFRNAEAKS
jgi:hypothetical protein